MTKNIKHHYSIVYGFPSFCAVMISTNLVVNHSNYPGGKLDNNNTN